MLCIGQKEVVYQRVDVMPNYPGGERALKHFLARTIYPEKARRMDIEGQIYIQFIIDKNGKVIRPQMLRLSVAVSRVFRLRSIVVAAAAALQTRCRRRRFATTVVLNR